MLPTGVLLDYANKCHSEQSAEGLVMTSLDTTVQANPQGGFNASATIGNKMVMSFMNYNGLGMGSLTDMTLRARCVRGVANALNFNFVVDLAGNGNPADFVILLFSTALTIGSSMTDVWLGLSTENKWRCVGGGGTMPGAGKAGLPPHTGSVYVDMAYILAQNPNAKLINYALLDNGMPKGLGLGGIVMCMNSSGETALHTNIIESVIIGADTYSFI